MSDILELQAQLRAYDVADGEVVKENPVRSDAISATAKSLHAALSQSAEDWGSENPVQEGLNGLLQCNSSAESLELARLAVDDSCGLQRFLVKDECSTVHGDCLDALLLALHRLISADAGNLTSEGKENSLHNINAATL